VVKELDHTLRDFAHPTED